nr:uncharacterized protein LOC112019441 [Ipomoea trifida]
MKTSHVSSLSCELKIIGAKNIDTQHYPSGSFFVRCYLSAGNGQKAELNSREIPPSGDLSWNESFSLDCLGSEENISLLKLAGDVVFELRWRRRRFPAGSKLVGRAQIPWKLCFEAPNMEIEKWVFVDSKKGSSDKPPALQIAMKVKAEERRRRRRWGHDDECECGCMDGGDHGCADYEIFALGAALEAF